MRHNHSSQSLGIENIIYSTTERMVPELIPVLDSQLAGDVSHKPDGRLPLLSARPAVTLATLKRAATNFAAWWTEAHWVTDQGQGLRLPLELIRTAMQSVWPRSAIEGSLISSNVLRLNSGVHPTGLCMTDTTQDSYLLLDGIEIPPRKMRPSSGRFLDLDNFQLADRSAFKHGRSPQQWLSCCILGA